MLFFYLPVYGRLFIALISVVCGCCVFFRQYPVAFVIFHFGYLLVLIVVKGLNP